MCDETGRIRIGDILQPAFVYEASTSIAHAQITELILGCGRGNSLKGEEA